MIHWALTPGPYFPNTGVRRINCQSATTVVAGPLNLFSRNAAGPTHHLCRLRVINFHRLALQDRL
jgi:hypothetical protein